MYGDVLYTSTLVSSALTHQHCTWIVRYSSLNSQLKCECLPLYLHYHQISFLWIVAVRVWSWWTLLKQGFNLNLAIYYCSLKVMHRSCRYPVLTLVTSLFGEEMSQGSASKSCTAAWRSWTAWSSVFILAGWRSTYFLWRCWHLRFSCTTAFTLAMFFCISFCCKQLLLIVLKLHPHLSLIKIPRDTTSSKEWANIWSPDKKTKPSSLSIMKLKGRTMKSTLMAPKWTREGGGAAAVINRHFLNGETTCCHLPKRLPDNSTIFAAEDTAITLALDYYQHMTPIRHDVVVYSDSMFCLQVIEGDDTENPFICHIMNLLWLLSDKGTHVRFYWIPSHCGIGGNESVDQLANETFDHDTDPLTNALYADLKFWSTPISSSWFKSNGRDLYLLKPTLGHLRNSSISPELRRS